MKSKTQHIVIAGGQSAGHFFPGLAVANELAADLNDWQITFAGVDRDQLTRRVLTAGFNVEPSTQRQSDRKAAGIFRKVAYNLSAVREAKRILRETQADLVVGLGDSASIPFAQAAISLQIPLVLLEQNAYPSRATQKFAGSAAAVCAGFPEVHAFLDQEAPVYVTGNPLRRSLSYIEKAAPLNPSAHRYLVILTGNDDSSALNEQVPKALYKLGKKLQGWRVIHQSGAREKAAVEELYRKLGVKARVVSFIENISYALRRADLTVCRPGGTTLSELAMAGVPAVLVPSPRASNDHQARNAAILAARRCSRVLDERQVVGRFDNALTAVLSRLIDSPDQRRQLATAMRLQARPDAAWHVAAVIADVARTHQVINAS